MMLLRTLLVLIMIVSGFGLVACGGTSYQYRSVDETKPGPGLFSGEYGVFTLYSNSRDSSNNGD